MKKIGLFLLIAVLFAGTVSAQTRNNRLSDSDIKPTTIEGTLQLEMGSVAVASGDSVYLVPFLTRYIGFIENLKEGQRVSVEGYTFRNVISPVKVTIAGKSYDFPMNRNFSGGFGMMGPGLRNNSFGPSRDNSRPDRINPPAPKRPAPAPTPNRRR